MCETWGTRFWTAEAAHPLSTHPQSGIDITIAAPDGTSTPLLWETRKHDVAPVLFPPGVHHRFHLW